MPDGGLSRQICFACYLFAWLNFARWEDGKGKKNERWLAGMHSIGCILAAMHFTCDATSTVLRIGWRPETSTWSTVTVRSLGSFRWLRAKWKQSHRHRRIGIVAVSLSYHGTCLIWPRISLIVIFGRSFHFIANLWNFDNIRSIRFLWVEHKNNNCIAWLWLMDWFSVCRREISLFFDINSISASIPAGKRIVFPNAIRAIDFRSQSVLSSSICPNFGALASVMPLFQVAPFACHSL